MAWGEQPSPTTGPLQDLVDELLAVLAPVDLPPQLVHGDIGGNVMFREDGLPVVIDMAPYWRPADWSVAVAAVDLLAWSEASPTILHELDGRPHMDQLLARALAYRIVTEAIFRTDPVSIATVVACNRPVVELLVRRIRDGCDTPHMSTTLPSRPPSVRRPGRRVCLWSRRSTAGTPVPWCVPRRSMGEPAW